MAVNGKGDGNAFHIRPQSFPWPPVHFAICIIAAFILCRILPLPFAASVYHGVIGLGLIAASALVDIWAVLTLRAAHTAIMPNRTASHLVTRGPFRFSRNPIYLGYVVTLTGFGFLMADGWFFIAAICFSIATTVISIRREEMHLLARFGIDFETYCKRTRRWI